MKQSKTNAMRILDREKVGYTLREFPLDGERAAVHLGIPADQLFKTLVTTDTQGGYYVFCIPSGRELDLKKAAQAVSVKRIEMLPQKELLKLTGYVHGGCSPVGMKKLLPTVVDESYGDWETVLVSAGRLGMLMELEPGQLIKAVKAQVRDVLKQTGGEDRG